MTAIQDQSLPEQRVNVETAARSRGVPASTLARWCAEGRLKSAKIGRSRYIALRDLDALLEHGAPQ